MKKHFDIYRPKKGGLDPWSTPTEVIDQWIEDKLLHPRTINLKNEKTKSHQEKQS